MKSKLAALDDHLRDENNDRRARIQGKGRGVSSGCLPVEQRTLAPTPEVDHAALIREFEARNPPKPSWFRNVPDGPFRVSYRYFTDRMEYVHGAASALDLVRWMRDCLSASAVDVRVWEKACR